VRSDALLALVVLACVPPAPSPLPAAARRCSQPIVLVTIDGVRWQEIFDGVDRQLGARLPLRDARSLLPALYRRFIDRGVALGAPGFGAPVLASGPAFVSLPGYRELLTGRPALGCYDNGCGLCDRPTLLDQLRGELGLPKEDTAVVASWEVTEGAVAVDPAQVVVSAGRHGGLHRDRLRLTPAATAIDDDAESSPAFPGYGDYRPDRYTGPLALEYLSARRPCFLYVELGDTDEYAHRADYPAYLASLGEFDDFLEQLDATLAALGGDRLDTLVLISTDHGRELAFRNHGADPASQRVWLVARGGGLPPRGLTAAAAPRWLADLAPTVRPPLGLAADPSADAGQPIPELPLHSEPMGLR
jgi:hypothetical protein